MDNVKSEVKKLSLWMLQTGQIVLAVAVQRKVLQRNGELRKATESLNKEWPFFRFPARTRALLTVFQLADVYSCASAAQLRNHIRFNAIALRGLVHASKDSTKL